MESTFEKEYIKRNEFLLKPISEIVKHELNYY